MRSRRSAAGRCESSIRLSAQRSALGAYQLGFMDGVPAHAAVHESVELVRAARLERAVPFTNAVLRRLSEGLSGLLAGLNDESPDAAALKHSYPDWIAEAWWRELGPDDARALMRAENEPPETAVRTPDGPTGRGRRSAGVARERLCMATEPWLAARRSRRGRPCRGADPRPLRGAGRQGDPARRGWRGGGRGREAPRPRPRAGRERTPARRRARGRERRRARAARRTSPASTACSWTHRAPGSASSTPVRTCAGGPGRSRSSSSTCSASRWNACGRAGRSRSPSARSIAAENEDVVETLGLPVEDLGAEWPEYRHPRRPEFLLTLPHVHGTAGFFVARVRA